MLSLFDARLDLGSSLFPFMGLGCNAGNMAGNKYCCDQKPHAVLGLRGRAIKSVKVTVLSRP